MKKETKKLKEIKKLIDHFSGVQSKTYRNEIRKTISFEVSDNEDITSYISALLEVCYYALDGNGIFISPANKDCLPSSSVTKVIEMIIELLPHSQMHCMDRIEEILTSKKKKV